MRVAGQVVVIAVLDGGDGDAPARRFAAAGATGLLLAHPGSASPRTWPPPWTAPAAR